ncbi:DUF3298 domain-containing protein [Caviibacter abscessus]|uniref:DUF3298 domain-containing protein n=1 Tax=Caviibacter abscessus TaxID=1766719 RepID=UPI000835DA45|nr:DUF3298 domain-containing protein [Caviibacter abscessus]
MKKVLFILTAISIMFNSYAASRNFTFQGFVPNSATEQTKVIDKKIGDNISYPVFEGNTKLIKTLNKEVDKLLLKYKRRAENHIVLYNIQADNSYFKSIIFTILRINTQTKEVENIEYSTINVDTKTGSTLNLSDLFVSGYEDAFNGAIKERMQQFGLQAIPNFKGVTRNQPFYLTDTTVTVIFNKGQATQTGDKIAFLPFVIQELVGIIK